MCISVVRQRNNLKGNQKRTALKALSWGLVLACMAVIFFLSHDPATQSQAKSDGVLTLLFQRFGLVISSHVVRKAAHALEFFGLSLLFYNAYAQCFRTPQAALSLLSTVLYAATDEIHQYFVLGRACQLRDVFVDFLGAAAGVVFCTLMTIGIRRFFRKSEV